MAGARAGVYYGALNAVGGSLRNSQFKAWDCRSNSFTPGTLVLMADGTAKAIDEVELGDWVLADDPETGERGARQVTDLIVGRGRKELIDIELGDGETYFYLGFIDEYSQYIVHWERLSGMDGQGVSGCGWNGVVVTELCSSTVGCCLPGAANLAILSATIRFCFISNGTTHRERELSVKPSGSVARRGGRVDCGLDFAGRVS